MDFLSAVLGSKFSTELFSEDYISALTYEHLLAGSATTSFTISVILYLVLAHQDVEGKLLHEIDEFGPPDRNPTAEDLDIEFPYLTQVIKTINFIKVLANHCGFVGLIHRVIIIYLMLQVIKEAMRFYTVSPLVAREASEPVQIGGYLLPKVIKLAWSTLTLLSRELLIKDPEFCKFVCTQGTWVWMSLNALAKDSRYFPEPEMFNPERFDPECDEEKNRHPYANSPFGIGPRACIGMKFALQEIKLVLIHLYQLFTFDHSPAMENPLEFQFGIVLSVRYGIRLRVRHRQQD